ncbi:MAG: Recombination protein MgsA [Candidatus Uhrbacteria bacterium GW2011_GWE2_40_58]|nr:MAG: Recombination protein MgsA [Candidatus Uhrbacteria bacterium GW2011_GWF2_40_263]KKR66840.1 MAG: Recombination protein MgsA [Candidatus Uhrbacteria bacterium GW2011_GWE2_40_58]OGL93396.1 MAG: AAA family ATPase [Candidatus Uhrbacteria bacterium RIFOXYA2_FULL_40_9]OGL97339.1 MAG: AAA family ATPase [Candidatus Uhrbacteria bacterium RIFOXYB2_FULL_41_18]HCB56149.1 AAA family ATPase [Candidatus Uhrbacteria bacterium]
MDLFDFELNKQQSKKSPLADRMRPLTFEEYLGQEQLIGKEKLLRKAIERDEIPSMIFWGPPGTGKTTLAKIIAETTQSRFIPFSAVHGGVKEIREIVKEAYDQKKFFQQQTILFVDEIHRFDKRQQDAFLPSVENGTIILIGATTENPSFEVNSALLSRCRVFTLEALKSEHIAVMLNRALRDNVRGLGNLSITISPETISFLASAANGDVRVALNAIELAVNSSEPTKEGVVCVDEKMIEQALQKSHLLYDRAGEQHYNIISALHKSLRGSDVNASLYWLGRMLEAGEDPLFVARRLVRFASEDIGLADPQALVQAVSAYHACHFIGIPECNVNLAQVVVYLAKAKKSNALYQAYLEVQKDIQALPNLPVPKHLCNAPTKLMEDMGYGKGYKYTPSYQNKEKAKQDYLPNELKDQKYYKE